MTITPEDLAALRYLNDLYERHCRPYSTRQAPPPPASGVEQQAAGPAREGTVEESDEIDGGAEG